MAASDQMNDLAGFTNVKSLGTSPTIYHHTGPGNTTWAKECRFIRAATAGTIYFVDAYDSSSAHGEWAAGETRAVASKGIIGAGTTATGIEGMP